jgi:NAD(P)-dependent dehydrogenase (short-subunit alcohol dehydrogenase family)
MGMDGRRVLITGGARRIGRLLALAVAQAGGDVVIHYGQSRSEAEQTRAEIEALGRKAALVSADLADPAQASGLLGVALEGGPIFALVNNAAIFEPLTWDTTGLEAWNRHLAVNLTAPFLLSQAFGRSLPPDETGRIVNLLDWRALRPGPDHLAYTISKAALAALTRSLAAALAPHITVNGLALGAVLPPADGEVNKEILDNVHARRWAGSEEVGQALIFLLDGPAYITGEILHLDGGRHLL